jgi:hypothetical protein
MSKLSVRSVPPPRGGYTPTSNRGWVVSCACTGVLAANANASARAGGSWSHNAASEPFATLGELPALLVGVEFKCNNYAQISLWNTAARYQSTP